MPAKIVKGHCPNCGPGILAEVVADFHDEWQDDDVGIWGNDDHRIMQCRGCSRVYFQTTGIFSEDDPQGGPNITHWPLPEKRKQPKWLWRLIEADENLPSLINETYTALNNDAPVLAAIGLRTIFDRGSELLGVDQNKPFAEKLNELVKKGNIGEDERGILGALTDAGSAAAHRGWRPSDKQLDTMFDIVEGFIHRSFFVRHAAKQLKAGVPPKSKNSNSQKT